MQPQLPQEDAAYAAVLRHAWRCISAHMAPRAGGPVWPATDQTSAARSMQRLELAAAQSMTGPQLIKALPSGVPQLAPALQTQQHQSTGAPQAPAADQQDVSTCTHETSEPTPPAALARQMATAE